VVGACVDGCHSVISRWQALRNVGAEDTILGGCVQTREEREIGSVEDVRRVKVAHLLNDNVRMSHQNAVFVDLLRGRKVGLLSICEVASVHVLDLDFSGEGLVRWDGLEIGRRLEL